MFITDLDNTLVGDDAALKTLNYHLEQHRQAYGTLIVYATGRSPELYQELKTEKPFLLTPDALLLSVGTEIYHHGQDDLDPDWVAELSHGWDRDQVAAIAAHFADLVPQSPQEQTPFKASYHLSQEVAPMVLPQLEASLQKQGLDIQLIYSSGKDLDILPSRGNKGAAIAFLQQTWRLPGDRLVVCGDSGNDISMFAAATGKGIIVGNAQPELREWHHANPSPHRYVSKAHCAGGILEGLRHFGFLEA
nr:sucrose-phosphate phosphatase [Oculatella sp. LEGE 06141]